jgi:hypothetical protein
MNKLFLVTCGYRLICAFVYISIASSLFCGEVTTSPDNEAHKIYIQKNESIIFTAHGSDTVTTSATAGNGAIVSGGGNSQLITFPESAEGLWTQVTFTVTHVVSGTTCTDAKKFIYDVGVTKVEPQAVATVPTNRNRTRIGVGEEVSLSLKPSAGAVDWEVTASKDATISPQNGATTTLTAEDTAATVTVKATKSGRVLAQSQFTIVEPQSESAIPPTSIDTFPAGTQGVGMHLEITVAPTDVCFDNVEMIELPGPASNITGYYTQFPASSLAHAPNPSWVTLSSDNKWLDHAAQSGYPSPWSKGAFDWDIPMRWRVVGKTNQKTGVPNRLQRREMLGTNGETKMSKLGQSTTRTP